MAKSRQTPMSKAKVMRYVPLFAGLSDQELQHLVSRLGRRTFAKGRIIFHKGSVET